MNQDADLPLRERLTMRLHLLVCAECRNFKQNSASLRQIMQQYTNGESSPASSGFFSTCPKAADTGTGSVNVTDASAASDTANVADITDPAGPTDPANITNPPGTGNSADNRVDQNKTTH